MSARRVVIVLLLALAEASVIEPLLLLLPTPLRLVDRSVALVVTVILLGGIALSRRLMAVRDAKAGLQRTVLGAWLVGLLLISIVIVNVVAHMDLRSLSVLFIELSGVLLIWWRGVALGVTHLGPDSARLRLQLGLLLFIVFALATAFNPAEDLMIFILPFLVGALFALPLCHLERIEESPLGRPMAMDARWWRAIGWGVGLPVIACIAVAMLVTGDTLANGLRLLVAVLLIPLLAIAFVVGYAISWLIALIFNKGTNPLAGLQGLGNLMQQLSARPDAPTPIGITLSPEARYAIGLVVLAVIVGVLIWLTGRARREAATLRAQSEDLQDLQMPDEPAAPTISSGLFKSLSLRRWLAALTIRRIYARLSHEAGKRGYARAPAQTPFDYLPHLADAFPGGHADLHIITSAYVAAHYGEVPDTDEALAQIRAAWDRVRAIPRRVQTVEPA